MAGGGGGGSSLCGELLKQKLTFSKIGYLGVKKVSYTSITKAHVSLVIADTDLDNESGV